MRSVACNQVARSVVELGLVRKKGRRDAGNTLGYCLPFEGSFRLDRDGGASGVSLTVKALCGPFSVGKGGVPLAFLLTTLALGSLRSVDGTHIAQPNTGEGHR